MHISTAKLNILRVAVQESMGRLLQGAARIAGMEWDVCVNAEHDRALRPVRLPAPSSQPPRPENARGQLAAEVAIPPCRRCARDGRRGCIHLLGALFPKEYSPGFVPAFSGGGKGYQGAGSVFSSWWKKCIDIVLMSIPQPPMIPKSSGRCVRSGASENNFTEIVATMKKPPGKPGAACHSALLAAIARTGRRSTCR